MIQNVKIVNAIRCRLQHYNPNKYWKRREKVINPASKTPRIIIFFYLLYLKKCDAYNCASFGTNIGFGATFQTPPKLLHGLNGIVIHYNVSIGRNCTICQQVTIGDKNKDDCNVHIGDNVYIGAGAKILGHITIGNNVTIGANAVVLRDVPDNSIAVGIPARIIKSKE